MGNYAMNVDIRAGREGDRVRLLPTGAFDLAHTDAMA